MIRTTTAVVLALAIPAAGSAQELGAEIRTHTLANGLEIIVWPSDAIPNVALYQWVRAGGRNEYPGITGLSHYFEHMMFNGTSRREPGEFDRIMEAYGGSNNAYTSNDVTVYQDWFPASVLEVIFDLEADRFADLAFDPEVIESERGVVYSERRTRVDNDNFGTLYEQMNANAYIAHPYQFPVIGFPSDIENWTHQDLTSFFKTYYAPNNVTMIVAGDVDPDALFALAEEYFGHTPAQQPPPPVRTVEPEQLGERRFVVEKATQAPLLQMMYKSPPADDPDSVAIDLLLSVLADGDSSRLHRLLVEERRVALSVGAYRHDGFDPGTVLFYMTLPPGSDPKVAEGLLKQALAEVVAEGITAAELEKARNIARAGFWRSLQTINGRAQALGSFEVFHGDWRKLFQYPAALDAATRDQVKVAAGRVFKPTSLTVGWLVAPEK